MRFEADMLALELPTKSRCEMIMHIVLHLDKQLVQEKCKAAMTMFCEHSTMLLASFQKFGAHLECVICQRLKLSLTWPGPKIIAAAESMLTSRRDKGQHKHSFPHLKSLFAGDQV